MLEQVEARAVADYLSAKWQVAPERVDTKPGALDKCRAVLAVKAGGSNPPPG